MKISKRVKINFESVNGNNFTIIPTNKITKSYKRIKEAMKQFKKQ